MRISRQQMYQMQHTACTVSAGYEVPLLDMHSSTHSVLNCFLYIMHRRAAPGAERGQPGGAERHQREARRLHPPHHHLHHRLPDRIRTRLGGWAECVPDDFLPYDDGSVWLQAVDIVISHVSVVRVSPYSSH